MRISKKCMKWPLKSALFLKFSENFRFITYFDVIFEILVKFSGRGAFRDDAVRVSTILPVLFQKRHEKSHVTIILPVSPQKRQENRQDYSSH